jgi:hypothetical protein
VTGRRFLEELGLDDIFAKGSAGDTRPKDSPLPTDLGGEMKYCG